jgi:hypothetical protein
MRTYRINGTNLTPKIDFNGTTGEMSITGKSIFFEKDHFWDGLFIWYMGYLRNPKENTVLTIDLEYFNSQTSTRLLCLLKMSKFIYKKDLGLTINWVCYDQDEDVLDQIQVFRACTNLPINIKYVYSTQRFVA